jgi:hypothetical protein
VTERRQQPLRCRQSVNRSTDCRGLKHRTRLPRASEDRGTPFRDGLKTCCSETSTVQRIIYNTNRAVWSSLVLRKTSQQDTLWSSSSPPPPPQEKNQQPTQRCLPIKSSITSVCSRDRSHREAPIRESSISDPCKGIPPKTSKRPRVDTIKNAPVEPSCHCTGTTTVVRSNQNVTYVIRDALRTTKSHLKTSRSTIPPPSAMRSRARAMSQDYPLTGPSPGVNQHTYPSSLPPVRGNLLSNISSKGHCFFSSPLVHTLWVLLTLMNFTKVRCEGKLKKGVAYKL